MFNFIDNHKKALPRAKNNPYRQGLFFPHKIDQFGRWTQDFVWLRVERVETVFILPVGAVYDAVRILEGVSPGPVD